MKKIGIAITFIALTTLLISGCGSNKSQNAKADGTKVIKIAHNQSYKPYDYVNEEGESDGYEVAVLKEVDKLLPNYTFEYVPTSDDDLLIGVETGKYNVGTKGAWITEERKKKYVIPQNGIAVSVIGIAIRSEDQDKIKDLESFAKTSGKLVPIAPQNAQYTVVEDFNKEHPKTPIDLIASESFDVADAYQWVIEGRYDAYFNIKLSYQESVEADDGPYHSYSDELAYVPYKGIQTYPLFNKDNQELADEYDKAIGTLKENGTLEKLSQQYFGENVYDYLTD